MTPTTGAGSSFAPRAPLQTQRRYLPDTDVLETLFTTSEGAVRVTDAMALPNSDLGPTRELIRRVDGVTGRVPMCWRVTPAFAYGAAVTRLERRAGIPVAVYGRDAVAVCSWEAGEPQIDDAAIFGRFETTESNSALIALCAAHQEPLVFPRREDVEARLEATTAYWRRWTADREYVGPWRDGVVPQRAGAQAPLPSRCPSGAIAAAASASLPEEIGGERNWDYRFCWVRDSAFTSRPFCVSAAQARPRRSSGGSSTLPSSATRGCRSCTASTAESEHPSAHRSLDGYRGSRPVRVGNAAAGQTQLDIYGDLLQTALVQRRVRRTLDAETGRRLAGTADLCLPDLAPARFRHLGGPEQPGTLPPTQR